MSTTATLDLEDLEPGQQIQFSFNGFLIEGTYVDIRRGWIEVTLTNVDGSDEGDEPDGLPGEKVAYDLECCIGFLVIPRLAPGLPRERLLQRLAFVSNSLDDHDPCSGGVQSCGCDECDVHRALAREIRHALAVS